MEAGIPRKLCPKCEKDYMVIEPRKVKVYFYWDVELDCWNKHHEEKVDLTFCGQVQGAVYFCSECDKYEMIQ